MFERQKIILSASEQQTKLLERYIEQILPEELAGKIEFIHTHSAAELELRIEALTPNEKCYVRAIVIYDIPARDPKDLGEGEFAHVVKYQRLLVNGLGTFLKKNSCGEFALEDYYNLEHNPTTTSKIVTASWMFSKIVSMQFGSREPSVSHLIVPVPLCDDISVDITTFNRHKEREFLHNAILNALTPESTRKPQAGLAIVK